MLRNMHYIMNRHDLTTSNHSLTNICDHAAGVTYVFHNHDAVCWCADEGCSRSANWQGGHWFGAVPVEGPIVAIAATEVATAAEEAVMEVADASGSKNVLESML
jgi:hypothetical protein